MRHKDSVIERRIVSIFCAFHCCVVRATHFPYEKGKNDMIFLDRESFVFQWEG